MSAADAMWDDVWDESVCQGSSTTFDRHEQTQRHYVHDQDHRHDREAKQNKGPIPFPSHDNNGKIQTKGKTPSPSHDDRDKTMQNKGPIPLLSLSFPQSFGRPYQKGQKMYSDEKKECTKDLSQYNKSYDTNRNNQNFQISPKYRRLDKENGESQKVGYRRNNDERNNHALKYNDQQEKDHQKQGDERSNYGLRYNDQEKGDHLKQGNERSYPGLRYNDQQIGNHQEQGGERENYSRETTHSQLDCEGSNHPRNSEYSFQKNSWTRDRPNRESSEPRCPRGTQSQDQTAWNRRNDLNSSKYKLQETSVAGDYRSQNRNLGYCQNQNQDQWQNQNQNQESHKEDAADFLLSNSEYHDCYLIVGKPESNEVEGIWAVSVHLIAHSPVFRDKFKSNRDKDSPESVIHITDVSPSTFRLMLRYVYGGKLPAMTAIDAARLALCGDKFKIPRLVQKALKRVTPTSAETVFPALICVASSTFPELELKVSKIIQEDTDKVVQNGDFLKFSEECVLYILKQDILNISELELWRNVVRWAKNRVRINPGSSIRAYLNKAVGYVRFLTFTLEEVMEHVLPTNVLTSDEFFDLTVAVSNMQQLQSPELCKVSKKRSLYRREDEVLTPAVQNVDNRTKDETSMAIMKSKIVNFSKSHIFKPDHYWYHSLTESECNTNSTLNIKPSELIEIMSFTCRSQTVRLCKFLCDITVSRSIKDSSVPEIVEVIRVEGIVDNVLIVLPLRFKNGQSLILSPEETWTFDLEFNSHFPMFRLYTDNNSEEGETDHTHTPLKKDSITVMYGGPFHVTQIEYKTE